MYIEFGTGMGITILMMMASYYMAKGAIRNGITEAYEKIMKLKAAEKEKMEAAGNTKGH